LELTEILKAYQKRAEIEQLTAFIQQKNSHGYIEGLKGSSNALVVAASFKQTNRNFVVIHDDKEAAAYLYNDLQSLLGHEPVEFFPSSYQRSIQYGKTDNSSILLRTDVLTKIATSGNPKVIVTYPEALMEKVIAPDRLILNTFTIKTGDSLSMDFLTELLHEYEFERTDFVYEPGQYAVRGSLIDVFSFSGDEPYRIDFFGDEIHSIRIFDLETQLTLSTPQKVTLIPNIQEKMEDERRISFMEFLPDETCFFINNLSFVLDRIDQIMDNLLTEKYNADNLPDKLPEKWAITSDNLKNNLQERAVIGLNPNALLKEKPVVSFDTSVQPALRKNFELLAETIGQFKKQQYTTYILSDSPEQIERLTAIFEDKGNAITFIPVNKTLKEGFIDHQLKICCFTDHQLFDRYHKFNIKTGFTKRESITLAELTNLHSGDYVVHIDHGIGKFGGLQKVEINGKHQEAIKLIYRDNDVLFVSIHSLHRITKYKGKETEAPKVHKLGSAIWQNLKTNTKKKVKDIAKDLIKLYAERKATEGFAFAPDSFLNRQLEASFLYEDTPDQMKATKAVKVDMESSVPMDRLICGDVGFGKTEIAIRAAFKAVADNKQVAILVPTTILALQHFKTFSERLQDFPCSVDYLSRMRKPAHQKEILEKLKEGRLDIVIGTHKLVGKQVQFKDLGLLVIDEEQKFGVTLKEKLKQIKTNVDTLTLTATPIPRTLQFSLMGARDLSIINTPPPNRQPIFTEVHSFNEAIIREAITYEVERNGQVFFIHNRVQNLNEIADLIKRLCPQVSVVAAHGQMEGHQIEDIMLDFIEEKIDVLVATTIIESGLDIPNANTIIINHAENYGLSDLHQLRGRVGRSNRKAFCYLLAPPAISLTNEARRRLKAIEDFSELGSGFNISLQDLDIRGAGNLLGAEQSGFIGDLGFEAYQKILDEAMLELQQTELKDLYSNKETDSKEVSPEALSVMRFVTDCFIDTDMELLFPDEYITSMSERINLYRKLDSIEDEESLEAFSVQLIDRFGPIPKPTLELLEIVRLRWLAVKLGMERVFLKNDGMTCWFVSDNQSLFYQSPVFQQILQKIQQLKSSCRMQEKNNKLTLTFENIRSVHDALKRLEKLLE